MANAHIHSVSNEIIILFSATIVTTASTVGFGDSFQTITSLAKRYSSIGRGNKMYR
jgi:glutathione peroxidase-family protein